jgi:putative SOS response-associated peptidase YedK
MCSHYQGMKERDRYWRHFGVEPPNSLGELDVWPMYVGSFIRRPREANLGDDAVPHCEAVAGQFGLIPHWATDPAIARRTYNARSETVLNKPSFRDAWRYGHRCIIPAESFFEPDWRTGKSIATRISRADGEPMGIAGLWSCWNPPQCEVIHSFTMLTINADEHPLMRVFHKPTQERRMVVILPENRYLDWLNAPVQRSMDFLVQYPEDWLLATPESGEARSASADAGGRNDD